MNFRNPGIPQSRTEGLFSALHKDLLQHKLVVLAGPCVCSTHPAQTLAVDRSLEMLVFAINYSQLLITAVCPSAMAMHPLHNKAHGIASSCYIWIFPCLASHVRRSFI